MDIRVKKSHTVDLSREEVRGIWIWKNTTGDVVTDFVGRTKEQECVWSTGMHGLFQQHIVNSIRRAKQVVCISSFLLGNEKIEQAIEEVVARGVRVYMLTSLAKLDLPEDEATKQDVEEHKKLLDRLARKVLLRFGEFHSKMLIVDPHDRKRISGILSTANMNAALEGGNAHKLEIGVKLTSDETLSMFEQFVYGFWVLANGELRKPGNIVPAANPWEGPPNLSRGLLPMTVTGRHSKILTLKEKIESFIDETDGPLLFSTFGIDTAHPVAQMIMDETKKREVTAILRPRVSKAEAVMTLSEAGVKVVGHPGLHAKAIVSTSGGEIMAMVMTANIEQRGLDTGFETGVVLTGERALFVKQILEGWRDNVPWEFKPRIMWGDVPTHILVPNGTAYEEVQVENVVNRNLGEVRQHSLEEQVGPRLPKPNPLRERAKRVTYTWEIVRPTLPSDARFVKDEDGIGVYKTRKGETLLAVTDERLVRAAVELKMKYPKKTRIVVGGSAS